MSQGQPIDHTVQELGDLFGNGLIRKRIQDKKIHIEAGDLVVIKRHLPGILKFLAFIIGHPGNKIIKGLPAVIFVGLHKRHALRQLPPRHLFEHFIIGPGKDHVHIVVPGDKAAVADGPQERPRVQGIFDLIFPADPVDLL